MLCYKQLSMVEQTFRTAKHLLATRPIFHKLEETIRGPVFCSFLALQHRARVRGRRPRHDPRRGRGRARGAIGAPAPTESPLSCCDSSRACIPNPFSSKPTPSPVLNPLSWLERERLRPRRRPLARGLRHRRRRQARSASPLSSHGVAGRGAPEKEQDGRTPFAPRCVNDVVEERLFYRRDLLTRLDLVFMDTTSLYFEGPADRP